MEISVFTFLYHPCILMYLHLCFTHLFEHLEKVLLDPIFVILECEFFTHVGSCFLKLHDVSTSQLEASLECCLLSRELLRKQERKENIT